LDTIAAFGVRPIAGDFISEDHQVRHDSKKLAGAILEIVEERSENYLNAFLPSTQRRASRAAAGIDVSK
jgi:hypothetical protein